MKTVMITGATSGIGMALVDKYHNEGFHVIACGRNPTKLRQLNQAYSNLEPLKFDVTDKQDIAAAADKLENVDILILNAGDCAYIDNALNFDGDKFASIIQTNLVSAGYLLQYFLPKLRSPGQLVFISSSATLLPFTRAQAYGASKAGLDYLANSLRIDLQDHGISVTLVHPGFVKTPLTDKNTFDMPFMISSDEAADCIFQGIKKNKKYIHFPKKLTLLLKAIALLPGDVWSWLARRKQHS